MAVATVKTVRRQETEAQGLAQVLELNSECCVEHIKTDRKVHRNKVCVTAGNLKRMKYQHKIKYKTTHTFKPDKNPSQGRESGHKVPSIPKKLASSDS